MSSLVEIFGKAFVPKSAAPKLRTYLLKAGITGEPYSTFGIMFFVSLLITIGLYFSFIVIWAQSLGTLWFGLITFIVFTIIPLTLMAIFSAVLFFYLDTIIFNRVNAIEYILPDYLQLVSSNVKSGMSLEKSMWYAIKPRFGFLAKEMEIVLKKVMTGYDLSEALNEFSFKYDSPMLRRSFGLIVGELDSGGRISHIIDSVVANLKNNQKMKAEMGASVLTYMIFIGVIVIVIAPVLFALSFSLLEFMDSFVGRVITGGGGNSVNSPINLKSGAISLEEFRQFSVLALVVVSICSSLIISILEKGNMRSGLKYIPMFIVGTLVMYFVVSLILQALFSGVAI